MDIPSEYKFIVNNTDNPCHSCKKADGDYMGSFGNASVIYEVITAECKNTPKCCGSMVNINYKKQIAEAYENRKR